MSENVLLKNYTTLDSMHFISSLCTPPCYTAAFSLSFLRFSQSMSQHTPKASHRTKAFSSFMHHQTYYTPHYQLSTMLCLLPVLTSDPCFLFLLSSHLSILLCTLNSFKLPGIYLACFPISIHPSSHCCLYFPSTALYYYISFYFRAQGIYQDRITGVISKHLLCCFLHSSRDRSTKILRNSFLFVQNYKGSVQSFSTSSTFEKFLSPLMILKYSPNGQR